MKALTVGGAMIDTIAVISDDLIERMSMSNAGKTFLLLEQGSKTEATEISTHCGGGAINAAVSFARLGLDVTVLAKVGQDERARMVRDTLQREHISNCGLRETSSFPTGASAIISAHDRNAAIFTFRGANTALREEDIEAKVFDAGIVYISSLSGDSALMLPKLVATAKAGGAFVVVNPGIRQISARFAMLRSVLGEIDIIAVNRSEAEAFVRQAVADLSGSENTHLRQIAADCLHKALGSIQQSRSDQGRALVEGFLQLGAKSILLTDGRHGGYFGTRKSIHFCPALEVTVASTAGAGDAYVSTFSGLIAMGHDVEQAMRAAAINSSAVVMRVDTQSGLLTAADLLKGVAAQTALLPVHRWAT